MPKITVEADDLKVALTLLDAYARKEKQGAHFKDSEQHLPDARYFPILDRLRKAVAKAD